MLKRMLIGLSVLLNVVVIGGAVTLYASPMSVLGMFLGDFVALSYERWTSQFEHLEIQAGDVVFLGDSITEGGAWDELFPGMPVRNRGIGGDTTSGVLDRLDQITRGRPGKVFLKIGTNDLFIGVPEAEIAANVARIVRELKAASAGTQVYVQSVLPRQVEYRQAVESLNERLQAVAAASGATWIDLYPRFLDAADGSIRDDLANDGLHLLGDGYLIWREQIARLVNEPASSPTTSQAGV
jgi:lysophospholipase L1-like esterase